MTTNHLHNLILGTYIGDSIGLPMEGMKPSKIAKLGWAERLRHRFIFGRGMWSDDTDHTLHMADSLIQANGEVERFKTVFSRRLRFWLSTLPPGIGLATLKSILKQFLGFRKTGVFSAGNGPAMRAAIIGAIYPDNADLRLSLNRAHTELTHTDPKALEASQLVVEIAASFACGELSLAETLEQQSRAGSAEWQTLVENATQAGRAKTPVADALKAMNIIPEKGVSGYSYHTVPAVLYVGLKNDWHFESTIREIISLGGDTDSTAAIAGALCALHPKADIPKNWHNQLFEFPVSPGQIKAKCASLEADQYTSFIRPWFWLPLLLRNLTQLAIVIGHIILRLLPTQLMKTLMPTLCKPSKIG